METYTNKRSDYVLTSATSYCFIGKDVSVPQLLFDVAAWLVKHDCPTVLAIAVDYTEDDMASVYLTIEE